MDFNLPQELIEKHMRLKSSDLLWTTYLLSLGDGTTFNILGGKAREVRYRDSQAILQYEKADDIRRLQSLTLDNIVLLNGGLVTLKEVYEFIGTDYVPRAFHTGVDDSEQITSELLSGRSSAMNQFASS
jgi:hypothetical protein